MEHDFTFAGAELIETLFERSQGFIPLPSSAIASESGLDGLDEVLIPKRFGQELHGTTLHRLNGHGDVRVCRDEDDRHLPICDGKVTLKLKPASSWQSNVEYLARRTIRRSGCQEVGNRGKFPSMQADRPQQAPDGVAKLGIVVDDQHAWILVNHPRSCVKGSAFFPLE